MHTSKIGEENRNLGSRAVVVGWTESLRPEYWPLNLDHIDHIFLDCQDMPLFARFKLRGWWGLCLQQRFMQMNRHFAIYSQITHRGHMIKIYLAKLTSFPLASLTFSCEFSTSFFNFSMSAFSCSWCQCIYIVISTYSNSSRRNLPQQIILTLPSPMHICT